MKKQFPKFFVAWAALVAVFNVLAFVSVGWDGVEKYTCVLIKRAMFGQPAMVLQTAGETIVFNTPTTSGEFLADDSATHELFETAVVDTEEQAIAWVTAVLA